MNERMRIEAGLLTASLAAADVRLGDGVEPPNQVFRHHETKISPGPATKTKRYTLSARLLIRPGKTAVADPGLTTPSLTNRAVARSAPAGRRRHLRGTLMNPTQTDGKVQPRVLREPMASNRIILLHRYVSATTLPTRNGPDNYVSM